MNKKAPGRQEPSTANRVRLLHFAVHLCVSTLWEELRFELTARLQRLVPLVSVSGGGSARELITEMCKQLLGFEESLDWEFVYAEKFRRYRSPWRLQLNRATSLKQFEQAFKDLVKVRSVIFYIYFWFVNLQHRCCAAVENRHSSF